MSKTRAKNLWSRIWLPNVVAISQEAFHRRLFRWTDEKVLGNGSMDWSTGYYLVDCFIFFAMSAIKWHVCFVDCSLIYSDFQRLFVFRTFEFGTNFGPRWFSLGFEFETIYGKICKKMNNTVKKSVVIFWLSWRNKELIWKLITCTNTNS